MSQEDDLALAKMARAIEGRMAPASLTSEQLEQLAAFHKPLPIVTDFPYATSSEEAWENYQNLLALLEWFSRIGNEFLRDS